MGDAHDLFLVDNQSVGLGENVGQWLGQLGVDRLDRLPAVLAVGVIIVGINPHRARPVQRQDCDDIGEAGGLQSPQQIPHRCTVELENPECVTAGQQFIGGRII